MHKVAFILLIIGGLNWLLVGLGMGGVGEWLGGGTVATIIYVLVGLSALYLLFTHKRTCKACDKSMPAAGGAM